MPVLTREERLNESKRRDLRRLLTMGLIPKWEFDQKMKEMDYRLKDALRGVQEDPVSGLRYLLGLGSWEPEPMPTPQKQRDSSEVELVKNIIINVLTEKMDAKQTIDQDAYRVTFGATIPRNLIVQGSIRPAILHLEALKAGLCKVFDDVIEEIRVRNGRD